MILDGSNTAYDPGATIERMQSLETFNSKLYATAGTTAGDGDIFICSPATAGDANKCDSAFDWATSYDASQESFESLYALGGTLYAGQGNGWGDGDLYACNPAGGGSQPIATMPRTGQWHGIKGIWHLRHDDL